MNKTRAFSLAIALLLAASLPVMAAGELAVAQETFLVLPSGNTFAGTVFAEVRNTGDQPLALTEGLLELFGADGSLLASTDKISFFPAVLGPGGTGYLYARQAVRDADSAEVIASYKLSLSGGPAASIGRADLVVQSALMEDLGEAFWDRHLLQASIQNPYEQPAFGITVVFIVKDSAGKLLYVSDLKPSQIGLPPGSSLIVYDNVLSDVSGYLLAQGIQNWSVEALAYALASPE